MNGLFKALDKDYISRIQNLSEDEIERYKDDIDWACVCKLVCLSEDFIERNKEHIDWNLVSRHQNLSEDFIERHKDELDCNLVSKFQTLSEGFIERNSDYVNWDIISYSQRLSISFIERHYRDLDRGYICSRQKLSDEFMESHKYELYKTLIWDNWIYNTTDENKKAVISTGRYECHDDYFIAYKAIRKNRYSLFNFRYRYEKGGIYESWCDCSDSLCSFGLSVGTYEEAYNYGSDFDDYMIVRCRVRYSDVGRVIDRGKRIRCFGIEIMD